jgi:predicted site-specific integrase-resolvase
MIIKNEVNTVYLTNKDRLLRFGTELIITIAEEFNTSIKILSEKQETFEETLSKDVLEIITVFSSRLYGKRSHSNINKLKKISN